MLNAMFTVFIGLGTNLGEREENLRQARVRMSPLVTIRSASTVIETAPWGFTEQPDFLNQVLCGETAASPQRLLFELKAIERSIGRTPTFRYGPRLIDLDILYYDELVLALPALEIPHPRLHERTFVLGPLAEIAPDWIHPALGKNSRELLDTLKSGL
jgi:2-amino-4-hydroxy-6-hydroxymethyldihydropteridine diphosphokinase